MTVYDLIAEVKASYKEVIKPAILEKNYQYAGYELQNLYFAMQDEKQQITLKFKSGFNFIAAAGNLSNALLNSPENLESVLKIFESYMAQTDMPVKK